MDLDRARAATPRLGTAPYFSKLESATARPSADEASPEPRLLEGLRRVPASVRRRALEQVVQEQLARILRLDPGQIDAGEPFARYGFDSLMALELRNRLQAGFAVPLSMADIVTNTSVTALSSVLEPRLPLDAQTLPSVEPAQPPAVRASGAWVVLQRPVPDARVRLFCFPYAGGAAPVFAGWPNDLPPEIEVCAIQPPGRHERLHEPLLGTVDEMVASLVPALLPYLDKPFATFGHCLGAIVMFEALRVLAVEHGKSPLIVFASAAPAPHRYLVPGLTALSQSDFADVLRTTGFAHESMLVDGDAQEHMMPAVQADFNVAARYAFAAGAPITAPIVAFTGLEDIFAPIDLIEEWRSVTTGRFSKVAFPGGHYFIVPERTQVLAQVREEILGRLARDQADQAAAPGQPAPARWALGGGPSADPPARFVCVPGVGQTSRDHASWAAMLGDDVELCVAELPGHGARGKELPLARVDEQAAELVRALAGLSDRPFALFGADVGALVAFEAARQLQREGRPLPFLFVVSSAMAPHLHYFAPVHHFLPDRFQSELRRLGIEGHAVPERALRADCAAMSTYAFTGEPLDVPILALGGELDYFVPIAGVRGWSRHTRRQFTFEARPGRHHPTLEDQARIVAIARAHIAKR